MYKNTKNIGRYIFGNGSISQLNEIIELKRTNKTKDVVFLIDHYFQNHELCERLPVEKNDKIYFIDTTNEPDTEGIGVDDSTTYCGMQTGGYLAATDDVQSGEPLQDAVDPARQARGDR